MPVTPYFLNLLPYNKSAPRSGRFYLNIQYALEPVWELKDVKTVRSVSPSPSHHTDCSKTLKKIHFLKQLNVVDLKRTTNFMYN
jgi:hypothetical protein